MTGFGMAITETNEKKITVGIKSLNHKFIEVSVKIPSRYLDKELEIKNICSRILERGKVYVNINIENNRSDSAFTLNLDAISSYYKQLSTLSQNLNAQSDNLFSSILHLPEVVKESKIDVDEEDNDWELLKTTLNKALDEINAYRLEEGISLSNDILKRIDKIVRIVEVISTLEVKQRNNISDRLYKKISEISMEVDNNRMEQEILFYVERSSIVEELTRLEHHCRFFKENLDTKASKGKKLSFIIQEILRELNTINSKSIDPEIQKLSIEAKEEVDNIKEQLFNVL